MNPAPLKPKPAMVSFISHLSACVRLIRVRCTYVRVSTCASMQLHTASQHHIKQDICDGADMKHFPLVHLDLREPEELQNAHTATAQKLNLRMKVCSCVCNRCRYKSMNIDNICTCSLSLLVIHMYMWIWFTYICMCRYVLYICVVYAI